MCSEHDRKIKCNVCARVFSIQKDNVQTRMGNKELVLYLVMLIGIPKHYVLWDLCKNAFFFFFFFCTHCFWHKCAKENETAAAGVCKINLISHSIEGILSF